MISIASRLQKIEALLPAEDEPPLGFIIEFVGVEPGTMARTWGIRNTYAGGACTQEYLDPDGNVVDEDVWMAAATARDNGVSHYQSGGRD